MGHTLQQGVRACVADRGYSIVQGKIAFEGHTTEARREHELVKRYYLGV